MIIPGQAARNGTLRKRDGSQVPFAAEKITRALVAAGDEPGGGGDRAVAGR